MRYHVRKCLGLLIIATAVVGLIRRKQRP